MKKKPIVGITIACIYILVGCGQVTYPDLPNDAIPFDLGTYMYKNDDNALWYNK